MATVYSSVSPIHGTCYIGQPYGNQGNYRCNGMNTGIDFPRKSSKFIRFIFML